MTAGPQVQRGARAAQCNGIRFQDDSLVAYLLIFLLLIKLMQKL